MVVVLGVLALLTGMLVPALSSARAAGRSTACLSNMRQMGLAAQQYASVYNAWPAALRYERKGGVMRTVAWDWVTSGGRVIGPGPLWTFTDDPDRVQQCPEYCGESNFSGDPFTGYNYNTSYLGAEAPFRLSWEAARKGVAPHACARGSTCAMFGDGGWSRGANKFMRAPLKEREPNTFDFDAIYSGGQAFRHRGATNVAYLDGHVAPVHGPREGHYATPERLSVMGYPENGFLSDDDSAYEPR